MPGPFIPGPPWLFIELGAGPRDGMPPPLGPLLPGKWPGVGGCGRRFAAGDDVGPDVFGGPGGGDVPGGGRLLPPGFGGYDVGPLFAGPATGAPPVICGEPGD